MIGVPRPVLRIVPTRTGVGTDARNLHSHEARRSHHRKAKSKGWPGWPFVLILIFLYVAGVIAGLVAAGLVVAFATGQQAANGAGDDFAEFIIGYLVGASLGAIAGYLLVLALPDRSESEADDDEFDDRLRRRPVRADRDDDGDDRRLPKARRADEDDGDGWRRRRR